MRLFSKLLMAGRSKPSGSYLYTQTFNDSTTGSTYQKTGLYLRESDDSWMVEFNFVFNYTSAESMNRWMGLLSCTDDDGNGPFVIVSPRNGKIVLNNVEYDFLFGGQAQDTYHLEFRFNSPGDCQLTVTGTRQTGEQFYSLTASAPCSSVIHGNELILRYHNHKYNGYNVEVFRGGCYTTDSIVRFNYMPVPVFSGLYSINVGRINRGFTSERGLWTSLQCYERKSRIPLLVEPADGSVPEITTSKMSYLKQVNATDNLVIIEHSQFDTNFTESGTITVTLPSGIQHTLSLKSAIQYLGESWRYVGNKLSNVVEISSDGGTVEYWVNQCLLDVPKPYSSDGIHFNYLNQYGSIEQVTPSLSFSDDTGRVINTDNAFTASYLIDTADPECVKITVSVPENNSGKDRYCLVNFDGAPCFFYQKKK